MLQRDEAEGFIFTGYFYDQLKDFEKENTGLQDAFPDWLHNIDVDREKKRASEIEFASQAAPEVVRAAKPASQQKVDLAERELVERQSRGARRSWRKRPCSEKEDPARAYFVLARVATMSGNMQDAQDNFQKALSCDQGSSHRSLVPHLSGPHSGFAGRARGTRSRNIRRR